MPFKSPERKLERMRQKYANMTPDERKRKLDSAAEYRRAMTPEQKAYWRNLSAQQRKRLQGYNREYLYGLSPDEWDALFVSQGSGCAICKSPEPKSKKGWATDHCHTTGKVRGILCHPCNIMIGNADDNEQILIDAVFYILRHREVEPCNK